VESKRTRTYRAVQKPIPLCLTVGTFTLPKPICMILAYAYYNAVLFYTHMLSLYIDKICNTTAAPSSDKFNNPVFRLGKPIEATAFDCPHLFKTAQISIIFGTLQRCIDLIMSVNFIFVNCLIGLQSDATCYKTKDNSFFDFL